MPVATEQYRGSTRSQNEKLVMYGVTHMCAIDGFSGKVVGFISMPIKNTVEIYSHLFRYVEYIICISSFKNKTTAHTRESCA